MPTAVIYTRFSPRPNAKDCDSCERQEERCRTYCERKKFPIGAIFSDRNVSGGVFERPGLAAAIDQLGLLSLNGDCVLVVDSVDRLSRDMLVALTIRHEVERAGARIEYANGTPAATTPEGELFSNILAAFAAYERSRIRHATSRGMKRRQANGEWFGRPPVGWMRDPNDSKKLVPCEEEQRAIREAKAMQKDLSMSSQDIAKVLTNEVGLFRGNPWSARTIRRILKKGPRTGMP